MDPIDYLRGIRRRWRLVALAVVAGLVLAWLSMGIDRLSGTSTFAATTTLIGGSGSGRQSSTSSTSSRGSGSQTATGLQTVAALVRIDDVAERVAKAIKFEGDPRKLSTRVDAKVEQQTGFLKISARADDPERAKELADAFATQLLAYLVDSEAKENAAEAASLKAQIDRIRLDIKALDKQIAKFPQAPATQPSGGGTPRRATSGADPILEERLGAIRQLGVLSQRSQEVKSRIADSNGLEIVRKATLAGSGGGGLALPKGLMGRLGVGLVLGLLLGVALALVRDRFDSTIRTREEAEQHFGYPVLAEIPPLRKRPLTGPPRPGEMAPQVADAFRRLSAGLNGASGDNRNRGVRPRAILVTSAGAAEGKASVVASLAATLAEVGKTVMVLSCDFRHPEVHREFGIPNERGLADVLRASNGNGPALADCVWYTSVMGVCLTPSGRVSGAPDQLLASDGMRTVLTQARQKWDVVLIDTPPVLTSDMSFLLPQVDGVLVVARAATTNPELAERSSELLRRLHAPVLGVVLTGDRAVGLPRGYYRTGHLPKRVLGVLRRLPGRVAAIASSARRLGKGLRPGLGATADRKRTRGIPRLPRRSSTK